MFAACFALAARCAPVSIDHDLAAWTWNETQVSEDLKFFTAEPHPFGSARQAAVAQYIESRLIKIGLSPLRQDFSAQVPHPDLRNHPMAPLTLMREGRNILVTARQGTQPCMVILASHYDTKDLGARAYLGANDSGSSTASLLEILRYLKGINSPPTTCGVAGYFFDGEEATLSGWHDGESIHPARMTDNRYGSRYAAQSLTACKGGWCLPQSFGGARIVSLIVLDMIGSKNAQLSLDRQSDGKLKALVRKLDQSYFKGSLVAPGNELTIDDDHTPFVARGVPAIDMIDFTNLDHWHQPSDTLEFLDFSSMQKISSLATTLALLLTSNEAL